MKKKVLDFIKALGWFAADNPFTALVAVFLVGALVAGLVALAKAVF